MGGLGSGRSLHSNAKNTVYNYHAIDIRKWHREGLLTPGISFNTKWKCYGEIIGAVHTLVSEERFILTYRYKCSDEWINIEYGINLQWTPCHLGGRRPWLLCPVKHCGRRVAILYGGNIFACRHCYQLVYPSQRENIDNRATRKAEKIREQLQWEPGILNGEGLKPKGMHYKTFERLRFLHNKSVNISLEEAFLRFGMSFFDLL